MEYQWGKIKEVIKKYTKKAFEENNFVQSDSIIDKALVMFNNILAYKSGYALLDGMAEKLRPALQRACISNIGNPGDLNTILTSLDSFMKKLLIITNKLTYNEASTMTFCPLVKKVEIVPLASLPDYTRVDIGTLKGNLTYIIGMARNARNDVHNSPDMDMLEVASSLRYGFAMYMLIIIILMSDLDNCVPQLSQEEHHDFTDENNGMLLYEFFSFGNESIQLKNKIVNTIIMHVLFENGETPYNGLKDRIVKMSSNSVKEQFLRRRLDELVNKRKLTRKAATNSYNLHDNTKKEMQQLSAEFNANSSSFNASLRELLLGYGLEEKSAQISQLLMKFFSDNFNSGILDSVDDPKDMTGYNNYETMLGELKAMGCCNDKTEKLFLDLISLCKKNDIVIRLSLGKVYSSISDPDMFDSQIRQKDRTVYIDTQILLYSICVKDEFPSCNEPMFNIADNLINIRDSKKNIILKTQREYVNEVCNHLKEAIQLIPFVAYKNLNGQKISDNVFYRHYCLLLENSALPDGVDDFASYIEKNIDVPTEYVNNFDSVIRYRVEYILSTELMIDIDEKHSLSQHEIEESQILFSEEVANHNLKRSLSAIKNDAIMGGRLFNMRKQIEPFFLTWDKLFVNYRSNYVDKYRIKSPSIWKLFSPGRFINHLDLLDFKVDTSKISDEILSMIEYSDARKHTLKILDVFNKYIGSAITDKNKRRKYTQMTREIFSDSHYSNTVESEREDEPDNPQLKIGNMIIKIYEHYKETNRQKQYNEAMSNSSCLKDYINELKYIFIKNKTKPEMIFFTSIIDKYMEKQ